MAFGLFYLQHSTIWYSSANLSLFGVISKWRVIDRTDRPSSCCTLHKVLQSLLSFERWSAFIALSRQLITPAESFTLLAHVNLEQVCQQIPLIYYEASVLALTQACFGMCIHVYSCLSCLLSVSRKVNKGGTCLNY